MRKVLSNIVNSINLLTKEISCVSIKPVYASACYYISAVVGTTITTAATYYKIAGTTTEKCVNNFTHSSNKVIYTGDDEYIFTFVASGSFISDTNNVVVTFAPAVNGTVLPTESIDHKIGTGADVVACTVSGRITLTKDDYFEMFVTCDTDATVVTLNKMTVLLKT